MYLVKTLRPTELLGFGVDNMKITMKALKINNVKVILELALSKELNDISSCNVFRNRQDIEL